MTLYLNETLAGTHQIVNKVHGQEYSEKEENEVSSDIYIYLSLSLSVCYKLAPE